MTVTTGLPSQVVADIIAKSLKRAAKKKFEDKNKGDP
jgi:hypothetical protein